MTLSIIPTHSAAQWLLTHIHHILDVVGVKRDNVTESIIYVIFITLIALFIGWMIKRVVVYISRKFAVWSDSEIGHQLVEFKVFSKVSGIIPPLVVLALMPFAFTGETLALKIYYRVVIVYAVVMVTVAFATIVRFIYKRYNIRHNLQNLPLDGIVNTIVIVLWVIAVIISISVLAGKSPAYLLTGLGAFAAALMLIFRDSLLGLVASVQLSQNDMLHVGDWIMVPNTPADGVVLDVSLSRVKIQNFDNTIITLPPYTLISTSFQNYRGMMVSGVRRITMNLLIDCDSITPLTQEEIEDIKTALPLLSNFVTQHAANPTDVGFHTGNDVVNGTMDTNLGLMRAYMCEYILSQKQFSHTQQLLMRVLEPTPQGVPFQMYCFANTVDWTTYEAIRSALVEHALVVAPIFKLRVFNAPSGNDIDQLIMHTEEEEKAKS